jgi:TPR repeat protein
MLMLVTLLIAVSSCSEQTPTPKTEDKAARLLKDAEAGDPEAQFKLGEMYAAGDGVPKNAGKAVEWYQKAAAQGDVSAQLTLAAMYIGGDCVGRDLVRAYAWCSLAAARADEEQKPARGAVHLVREGLEPQLTAAERAEGQRLASRWKPGTVLAR